MVINVLMNHSELQGYKDFFKACAEDETEYAEAYQTLSENLDGLKSGFSESIDNGVVKTTARIGDYGQLDVEFNYDTKTVQKLVGLMTEHRDICYRIIDLAVTAAKLVSGISSFFDKANDIIEARKAERELINRYKMA